MHTRPPRRRRPHDAPAAVQAALREATTHYASVLQVSANNYLASRRTLRDMATAVNDAEAQALVAVP